MGERSVNRREAVQRTVLGTDQFRSAQQIWTMMRAEGVSIGLATVYRSLQQLTDAGRLDAVRSDEGEWLYRACRSGDHHHHLTCRHCGASVEVESSVLEQWTDGLARAHQFTQMTHTLEVFGTCGRCQEAGADRGADLSVANGRNGKRSGAT